MAIQNIGTTISGIASDTKPTLTANEKGVIFVETDTNKIYQWDTDSWNQIDAGAALTGSTNNTVVTVTGANAMQGESNLTFDGSTLTVTGEVSATTLDIGGTNVTSTAAELNLLDGVSGLVQADLTKLAAIDSTAAEVNLLDALDRGSILYGNSSGATTVLGQGSANQVLTSDGTDIAWQDAGGGGALEFVSKTTISSSTAVIDYTGLDYDTVYKLIIKRLEFTGYTQRSLEIKAFINGSSSVAGSVHDGSFQHLGGHQSNNSQDGWDFYQYGGENEHVTGTLEFYTGYYGYIRGMTNHVGGTNGVRYSNINGTLNASNAPSARISGIRITNTGDQSWVSGGQVLLYKYKES